MSSHDGGVDGAGELDAAAALDSPTKSPPIVARTRSTSDGLDDASKSLVLNNVGAIEHFFSNGERAVYEVSEHGNFGIGDVILGKVEDMGEYIAREEGVRVRGIGLNTNQTTAIWPNRTVTFRIDASITGANRTAVNNAITSWNTDSPVVRWVATTSTSGAQVRFVNAPGLTGCGRSTVGRTGRVQDLELRCYDRYTILHEMGHATGLEHEHQRCGRATFVNVGPDAMGTAPDDTNYGERCGANRRNYGDYDYGSIMHYFPTQFLSVVANPTGVFLGLGASIGTGTRLSQNDVNSINQIYTNRTTSTTSGAGFAWSSQLTGSADAHSGYSWNTANSAPHANISRLNTGRYRVRFPKLGSEVGGNVQVTAYGWGSERCKVEQWISSGADLDVTVRCNDVSGALVDTLFVASYQRIPTPGTGTGGYLYSNRLNAQGAYTPDPWYQYNSAGQSNRVTRDGVGRYNVEFPGVNVNGGSVRLTAFGANSDYCTIGWWSNSTVNVNCWDTNGNAKDSAFSVFFTENAYPDTYAYVWANDATAASYEPDLFYQRTKVVGDASGTTPAPIRIDRVGPGDYRVRINNVPDTRTTASVAAYDSNHSCKVAYWVATSHRQEEVAVRCFSTSGAAADSRFALSYFSSERIIP